MNNRNSGLVILLIVLGVVFLGFAAFYVTTDTKVLASEFGRHYKHAIVAAVLAVLCFVGANFARNRTV